MFLQAALCCVCSSCSIGRLEARTSQLPQSLGMRGSQAAAGQGETFAGPAIIARRQQPLPNAAQQIEQPHMHSVRRVAVPHLKVIVQRLGQVFKLD